LNSANFQGMDRLTYSTKQSPSCEANQFSVSQEIPRVLWRPKIYHRSRNSPTRVDRKVEANKAGTNKPAVN